MRHLDDEVHNIIGLECVGLEYLPSVEDYE